MSFLKFKSLVLFIKIVTMYRPGAKGINSSPELRHVSGLCVMFWAFFLNLVFFIKSWLPIV